MTSCTTAGLTPQMADFVDTNVLVYAVDPDDVTKQAVAQQVIDDDSLVISSQVLSEFVAVVRRRFPAQFTWAECALTVRTFSRLRCVAVDAALVRSALDIADHHQLSYWDALIVAAAARAGCSRLITDDLADGAVIAGVSVVNPFT